VIAALHDRLEYSDVPTTKTRARFRFLAENGADIVIGHHPHVLQGLEWHRGVPIAYSLGNLLFHHSLPHIAKRTFSRIAMALYAPEEIQRRPDKFAYGAVLRISWNNGRRSARWAPFRQNYLLRPQLSTHQTLLEDLNRLDELGVLLSKNDDPRYAQAERVAKAALDASRSGLTIHEVITLAKKPKLRYLPLGLKWVYRHLTRRDRTARSVYT
jgi:hypothetical protein